MYVCVYPDMFLHGDMSRCMCVCACACAYVCMCMCMCVCVCEQACALNKSLTATRTRITHLERERARDHQERHNDVLQAYAAITQSHPPHAQHDHAATLHTCNNNCSNTCNNTYHNACNRTCKRNDLTAGNSTHTAHCTTPAHTALSTHPEHTSLAVLVKSLKSRLTTQLHYIQWLWS